MDEIDVLRMMLARRDTYSITSVQPLAGRVYAVTMDGEHYSAAVLTHSFEYYEKRYHIAGNVPTLVICFVHDTVLSVPVLSLRTGNFARPYELPATIRDVEQQRHRSKTGSQVLLGMYLCGMRLAQSIINGLPDTTKRRYLAKAKALGKRRRGKPVGLSSKGRADT